MDINLVQLVLRMPVYIFFINILMHLVILPYEQQKNIQMVLKVIVNIAEGGYWTTL